MMIAVVSHQSKYGNLTTRDNSTRMVARRRAYQSLKDQLSILVIIVIQNLKQTVQSVLEINIVTLCSKNRFMTSPEGT